MKRGFTLSEVLVVTAIIALLAGILFPVFNLVKNRAKHTTCANNIHQLGAAEHLYANDHDGWVPPATMSAGGSFTHFDATPAEIAASPSVLRASLDPSRVRCQPVAMGLKSLFAADNFL